MANRVREDEKNERIIRGLLKLPENRRCINCNSLGPQYVCTNFWTFVCTTCSGIHREFTHRVKSVSMAKFTSQEVKALQEGGNKNAREIYLKEWDPQRQSAPDGSNVVRLRDFIKHVYVDRRYTGERSSGKPPISKLEDAFQGGSRSPPYEDTYERRHSAMSSPGGRSDDRNSRSGNDERRSPGYDQEGRQNNDYGRSPARPEVVNDWRREDRFANGRKDDDRRSSDGDSRFGRSPERLKDLGASSPPIVRPVREILGDSVVPLRIGEPPKANSVRSPDGSVQKQTQLQTSASSNSLGSSSGNVTEVKVANTPSLIDFDDDPVPPVSTTPPQVQQTTPAQSIIPPASTSSDNNWASFDAFPGTKPSQVASNPNSLESALSQLSVPASVPGHMPGMPGTSGAPVGNPSNLINPNPSAIPFNNSSNLHSASPFPVSGPWPNMQHQQPSPVPASSIQSSAQPFTTPFSGASGTQPWNSTVPPNVQATTTTPFVGTSQVVSTPVPGAVSTSVPQPPAPEVKPSGRRELPADLFAATYSPYHASVPGWHAGPPHGMGYAMPYVNAAMPMPSSVQPMPSSVQPSKSINPFDLNEPSSSQVQTFPSMASLHGALPNMPPPSGLQSASSLGAPPSAWAPSQSLPFSSAVPPQQPPYASAMPPRAYMEPHTFHSMPVSGHQIGGLSTEGNAFGAANMDQHAAGRFSTPANMQSPYSSAGGNPFG